MLDLTKTNTNVYTNKTRRHDIWNIVESSVKLHKPNPLVLYYIPVCCEDLVLYCCQKNYSNLTVNILPEKKKWDWYSLVTNIHFLKFVKCFKCTLSHLFLFLFLIYNIEFKQWVSDCCFTQTQQFLKLYHGENNLIFNEMMMRFTLH